MLSTMPSERVQRRIDDLLDQAERAVSDRDWSVVQEIADAVLVADPENEDAETFIAMAQSSLGVNPAAHSARHEPASVVADAVGPTTFANGRYEVSGLLGEGGKKVVYLAHDSTLDRDVAFALIKTEDLDETSRQRITLEAQSMGRLGDNPNIMPIFDMGDEDGQPFLVQPVMSGGDVESLIANAEDGRLSLEVALQIIGDTCRGLEFAHSKGIIHRDLKPSNVWLAENGTVRIGDFGLAISLDGARITQEQMMVGTVSYLPPEQATGGEVTPQSDLYTLGAMLYEMVTGRPPFLGDDEIAIIGQHINTPPVAPSWHNQSIPQTLDSLIMRLLAKDPAERPESATDVLRALDAINPAETAEDRDEEQGSLDSMAGGVFVGRHREMDQLKAAFEETLGGHGKMLTLVGEPGIGKTRTAQELATYAGMRGAEVIWGRSYEGGGAPPYWPWVQAIRSYVVDRDTATIRRELGSTAGVIAEVVPEVKERLPDLQPPPVLEDPESERFRLFDSITSFLKSASNVQPITLMLEDLHWSDKSSLMLLEFMVRELSNSRLMIVGNYRDMELNRRHPLSITLGDLTREHLFDRVVLRGLQKHDVRRFIEVAAGIDPPDSLVDVVHSQTEGNPLFVSETVRLLIQEGDIAAGLRTSGGTSSWEIRIPEGVREVIGRRFDRLSERCNEVLSIAAVVGRQFGFGVLMNLADEVSENMLLDVLDEALGARIVEEVTSEVGLYQFTHALMQETLTSELTLTRRVRLHARIAEALEDFYGSSADDHAVELVGHFAEAEAILGPDKLIQYSVIAGEQALALAAPDQALVHFERAMESSAEGDMDDLRARMTVGLAITQGRLSPISVPAGEGIKRAFDYYVSIDDAENIEAIALEWTFRLSTHSLDLMNSALDHIDPSSVAAGRIHARISWTLSNVADFDGAKTALAKAVAVSDRLSDTQLELDVLMTQIRVDTSKLTRAELGEMVSSLDRVQELVRVNPDPIMELVAHNFSANAHSRLGLFADSIAHAEAAYEIASNVGYSQGMVIACFLAYYASIARCDWEEAEKWVDLEDRVAGLSGESTFGRRLVIQALTEPIEHVESLRDTIRGITFMDQRSEWLNYVHIGEVFQAVPELVVEDTLADVVERGISYHKQWGANQIVGAVAALAAGIVAVATDDKSLAPEPYEALKPLNGYEAGMSTDRVMGLLTVLMGDLDAAAVHFEEALTFSRKFGCVKELAWSCFDYTGMLLERDAQGDRETAISIRDEGIATAVEFGMKPLVGRFVELSERMVVPVKSGSGSANTSSGTGTATTADTRPGFTDELTGLGVWRLFRTTLEVEQILAAGPEGASAVVKINLDGFRHINNSHGIEVGDRLLHQIAETLRSDLPPSSMLSRVGVDEFCFVLRGVEADAALIETGTVLQSILDTYVGSGDDRVHVSGTAGIVMLPMAETDADQIAVLLDESIRVARRSGRNSIHVYQSDDRPGVSASMVQKSTALILDALADDRFQLFRQPILSVEDRSVGHYEVLIRMVDADGSLRSPAEFIPQAESLNLIQQIDRWVVERAMLLWKSRYDEGEALKLAINVSGMSVGENIATYLREQADKNGVPHNAITIEITETAAMQDDSLAGEMAELLHADGFKLAIDDFGSGATSLAKVRELQFEYLKLDGILVKNLSDSEPDREFVSAISKLAHDIGVEVIAEFVQDEATMEFLADCGIEYGQGYYLGEPEPFPD